MALAAFILLFLGGLDSFLGMVSAGRGVIFLRVGFFSVGFIFCLGARDLGFGGKGLACFFCFSPGDFSFLGRGWNFARFILGVESNGCRGEIDEEEREVGRDLEATPVLRWENGILEGRGADLGTRGFVCLNRRMAGA